MNASATHSQQTVTRRDFVLGVIISSGFRMKADGFLYPRAEKPLVRVLVGGSSYELQRRRVPESEWITVQTMGLGEFDQAAFENWADMWPLA